MPNKPLDFGLAAKLATIFWNGPNKPLYFKSWGQIGYYTWKRHKPQWCGSRLQLCGVFFIGDGVGVVNRINRIKTSLDGVKKTLIIMASMARIWKYNGLFGTS